ncbi:MAG: hypothetical protein GEU88_07945 [Solirubrobacterales bacterium]|nr:hypothetical protein [Solirubrobacterales bacterium]
MKARRRPPGLSLALVVIATIALLGSLLVGYASTALFDSDSFADRATSALDEQAVQSEVGALVTDNLVLKANADFVAVRPLIESVVSGIVGGGAFQGLFRKAVNDVHRAAFKHDQNTATLTLGDIGEVVRGALQALRPQLSKQIKGQADVEITGIKPPSWVADLAQVAEAVGVLWLILLAIGVVLAAAAVWLSADRRRTVLQLGVGLVIAGVAGAVALSVGRALVLRGIDESAVRDAIDAVWGVFLNDLRTALYLLAACGAVIAAAASSLVRPVEVASPLRRAWSLVATVPETPRMRVIRALLLLVVGILIVVRHDAAIDALMILAGLYVAYAGASELLRLTLSNVASERAAQEAHGRRTLVAAAITAILIFAAGAAFVAFGGTHEEPLAVETSGCNGSEALCDRTLDQVAIPATHNAMSAVTNQDWLFGQQDAGFADQLHDGIRGLLIDAHYGQPTESGKVKTDLSDLTRGERATYEKALGPESLDAALRIRDRVVNSPTTGPRAVYLCHRFCELGAIPIDTAFKQYRDFLAANPNEVLVIVIEDYVEPQDIADAVKRTGLIDYVYKGLLEPLPTLQEIIDSGGQAVMMAEQDAGHGSIPWYHEAYDRLVQETPFTFKKPETLTDPKQLAASCEPNRGPDDAPLFLLNHWVDTTPAPRPSNAEKVNDEKALLKRVHVCERIRDLEANLIAVDFYREGDLFDVVDKLNAERDGAPEAP